MQIDCLRIQRIAIEAKSYIEQALIEERQWS